ncbi:NUDIX hydrolase [Patescibacteria group bacterium]|nr:NUDIX hydrolase [Patescibacteria group bacterium]
MQAIEKWEVVSREQAFKKYSRKIEKVIFKLPNGEENDYYIKNEGPAAGILALTPDNQVILAKQFRPGPNEILFELPGGYVDSEETPEQSAARELLEETGYQGSIHLVTSCFDDAYSTMNRYCFVATDCEKVSEQKLEKTEFAEVVLLPLTKFRELLRSGKMTDVEVGYLGLDYLNLL